VHDEEEMVIYLLESTYAMGEAPELAVIDLIRKLKLLLPPAEYLLADKIFPLLTLNTTM
jgi:hypothetical protein